MNDLTDPVLTPGEQALVMGVFTNQAKQFGLVTSAIKLAIDSGDKLLKLKGIIQTKYGRSWKGWCEAHAGELGISYRQVAKYMLVSQNQQIALEGDHESINDACEAISRAKRPEAAVARDEKKAEKRAQPKVTAGQISERALNEIDECTNSEQIKGLIILLQERLEVISEMDDTWNRSIDPASEDEAA